MQDEPGFLIGRTLNQYEIREYVGRGGASRVFRAHDTEKDRTVALKVLKLRTAGDESYAQRFRREIQVLMQLDHPHIVPVFDFGEDQGYTYLVMPYYAGGSLSDRIREGKVRVNDILRVFSQITGALSYAHQKDVIHRDVKSDNILFDEQGNALLSDFGLARMADTTMSITGSNIIGTPAYISPEQARGYDVSPSTDQYSLGIVLYEMLTGQYPFDAETPLGVLMRHVQEPMPTPSKINPGVPEIIDRVVLKATAKDPENRFPSISAMNDALQAGFAHAREPRMHKAPEVDLPVSIQATRAYAMPFLREKRNRVVLTVLGVFILIAVFASLLIPGSTMDFMKSIQDLFQPVSAVGTVPAMLGTQVPSNSSEWMPTAGETRPIPQTFEGTLCDMLSVEEMTIKDSFVRWTVRNESDQSALISAVQISWPAENGELRSIQVGDITWWVDLSPPTAVIPDWEGDVDLRTIGSKESAMIMFAFSENPAAGNYVLRITFDDDCSIKFPG